MAETLVELVARITADSTQLKRALSESEKAAEKASKSIGDQLGTIGKKMTDVGKQMSLKLTAPIVGIGVAAFKMSGDFDQAFRKVNVMLGASSEEAKLYKDRILEISGATAKSANDVAAAFYQIVSAGYRGADSLDILEVAMRGAVGGAAQTESTMAALTKAMNIFDLEGVSGATKAMDIFFGIVDTGLLSFEQMASAFPEAASSAAGLGISIEETGAALGTLTKVTGSTDEAATALSNAFMQLIKPSDKMRELYHEWGVKNGPEAIEKFGGLAGVLNKVKEETGGNVDELAELFPSIRAIKAVLPLVTTNADDFAQALNTVSNSSGKTSAAFDEMAQGPGFAWNQMITNLKNSTITLGNGISETLIPILKGLMDKIQTLTEWWAGLSSGQQKAITIFAMVVAAVGPLLIIFGQLAGAISAIITIAPALAIAFHAMLGPIGLITLAIAGLVAAGYAIYKNWGTISDFFKDLWDDVKRIFQSALRAVTGFVKEHWDKILAILFPAVGIPILIARNWGKIVDTVENILGDVVGIFGDMVDQAFDFGEKIIEDLWAGIASKANWIFDKVQDVGKGIWNAAKKGVGSLWGGSPSAFGIKIGDDLIAGIEKGVGDSLDKLTATMELIGVSLEDGLTDYERSFAQFYDAVKVKDELIQSWVGFISQVQSAQDPIEKLGITMDDVATTFVAAGGDLLSFSVILAENGIAVDDVAGALEVLNLRTIDVSIATGKMTEEQLAFQDACLEVISVNQTLSDRLRDVISEFRFAQTEAGLLGISFDEVIQYASTLKGGTEKLEQALHSQTLAWGDVNGALKLFGADATDVQTFLDGISNKSDKAKDSLLGLNNINMSGLTQLLDGVFIKASELAAGIRNIYNAAGQIIGGDLVNPTPSQPGQGAGEWLTIPGTDIPPIWAPAPPDINILDPLYTGPMPDFGFAKGGIATGPIRGTFGEDGTEALIPLNSRGVGILGDAMVSAINKIGGSRPVSGDVNVTNNFPNLVIREESDIDKISNAIYKKFARTRRLAAAY